MPNLEFGSQIRKLRLKHKMSMQVLANQLGVSKGAVNMWENKGVIPREDVLRRISSLFQVSIDSLLGNKSQDYVPNQKLTYIRRGLGKLDQKQLQQAEDMLKAVFTDIFDEESGDEDD